MSHLITRFYSGQHVDEQEANTYSVWRSVQDWDTQMIPKDICRQRIHRGLTREYASMLVHGFMMEVRGQGAAHSVRQTVDFLLDGSVNQDCAERIDLSCPLIY